MFFLSFSAKKKRAKMERKNFDPPPLGPPKKNQGFRFLPPPLPSRRFHFISRASNISTYNSNSS